MIYRTAHRTTYRNINDNLGLVSYRIAQYTNQLASEKRINTPSDDPTGASRVLGTRSTLSAINQYRTNVAVSDLWLAESGSAAQSIKEALDQIYSLTEQGATDSYSASQREAILTEVEGWFNQIIQDGNSQIGDNYIFSGQKVTTQSFAAKVEAQKVRPGCENSTAWTGQIQNYGSPVFNSRSDLPVHSQDFMVEVVQAGGVDSRWFADVSKLAGGSVNGGAVGTGVPMTWSPYSLDFTATDPRYNQYQVRFVAGESNRTATGSAARNNGLSFSAAALASALNHSGAVTVRYVLGDAWAGASAAAAASAAVYDAASAVGVMFSAGMFNTTWPLLTQQYPAGSISASATAVALGFSDAASAGLFDTSAYCEALKNGKNFGSAIALGYVGAAAGLFSAQAFNEALYLDGLSTPEAISRAQSAAIAFQAHDAASAALAAHPQVTAAYDGSGVITVTLATDGREPPGSVVSARTALSALGALASAEGWVAGSAFAAGDLFALTSAPPSTGLGLVGPGQISFNDLEPRVEVKDGLVTVYLPRTNSPDGQGDFTATASAVAAALRTQAVDPATGQAIFTASATGSALVFQPSSTWTPLDVSRPYTLAHATLSPRGTQNDLVWAVRNNGNAYVGEEGNRLSVQYVIPTDPSFISPTPKLEFNEGSGLVTVRVAADINVYNNTYSKILYETGNHLTAHEKAIAAAVTTTAADVKAMVNGDPAFAASCVYIPKDGAGQAVTGPQAQSKISSVFDVSLADGNSGDGRINFAQPRTYLADGYDQPALFRVSQDGGRTWGPPQSFGASEYQGGDMFHNAFLGHASLTTSLPGRANDLVFTARHQGTWGNDLRVEYQLPDPTAHPNSATTVTMGENPWNICVTLRTDAQGRVLSTAREVMEAVNSHPVASQMVLADLANYHEGGDGKVELMKCEALSVGEPYQVDGRSVITPLGHATATVGFNYSAPDQSDPNIIYQATARGPEGNLTGVRYTTSADPTLYASAAAAGDSYQKETTVRYETDPRTGQTVLVVHLASEELTPCPDGTTDPNAAEGWRKAFPLYSCTDTRAVVSTAGDVLKAVIDYNTAHPDQAEVWPQFERHPEGWDSTAKVGPTNGTVWLNGGNDEDSAAEHGVNLKFVPDGTALQVGDRFEVPVGWYRGDEKNMDVNLDSSTRGTLNTAGSDLLGGTGAGDSVLDTLQRLIFALKRNDTEAIGRELPHVQSAIEKVTTLESKLGTKQIRNKFVTNNLDSKQLSSESLLSSIEDVDFSRVISDLKNAQTVYEALLGATGLTTNISLLNYM